MMVWFLYFFKDRWQLYQIFEFVCVTVKIQIVAAVFPTYGQLHYRSNTSGYGHYIWWIFKEMTKKITVFFIRGAIQILRLIRKYIVYLKYNLINVSIRKSCFKKIVSFSSNFETKVRYILSFGVFVMIRTRCNVAKNVFEITNCILSNLPYECNPWHFWTEGKFAQQPWGHGTQPGTHWVVPCPIPITYQISTSKYIWKNTWYSMLTKIVANIKMNCFFMLTWHNREVDADFLLL